jgi:meso-butanediol dehydrogenase/(S,S)-butanediol dehydrogenase/diacetyl reductase
VRLPVDCERLVAAAVEAFGALHILVNNAGIGYLMKPLLDTDEADWDAVLDVNLKGAFLCTKYAARQMIAQGQGGRIINIASQAAKSGFPHMAPYTASKHGMVGLTRSNAVELGHHGITVNAVCPNHVTTGLGAKQNAYFSKLLGFDSVEAYLQNMARKNPMGRPGLPTDTAAACAFLASDEAVYITGEALNVSGGEEMH